MYETQTNTCKTITIMIIMVQNFGCQNPFKTSSRQPVHKMDRLMALVLWHFNVHLD